MNTVLLGGNGYIGRAVTEYWLSRDKDMTFYVLSRSGKNQLESERVINIAVDVTKEEAVLAVLPDEIAYVADFVGGLNDDEEAAKIMNINPARVMMKIADKYDVKAMGYIGGLLGPKSFTAMKKNVINILGESTKRLEIVEPTLVYGNGRSDTLAKLVPVFKVLGLFSKTMKPVRVTEVAKELVDKMIG